MKEVAPPTDNRMSVRRRRKDDVSESHGSTGRALLQAKTALKKFACPFADEISDEKIDCASTMFSHRNAMRNYPPALFASLCTEGKLGLNCSHEDLAKSSADKNGVPPRLTLTACFLMLLFKLF
ncbi:GPI-anchored protein LLG3-like [Actinidia eriantha]|uniref:GPI-anchored protein LLG3-like n=1 Tax=Actinidia eriantha TaxID=165200 RepID=UPI00258B73C2|nr:GPI-anchored protein LLG3-like [Actinidia eriantha]